MADDAHLPALPGGDGPAAPDGAADDGSVAAAAAAVDAAARRAHALTDDLAARDAADAGPSTALVPVDGAVPAEAVRDRLAAQRAALVHARADLDAARAELEARVRAQLAVADAALEPMRDMVTRLEDGIAAVALYLGRDETIETLRDGTPAPAAEPITVRQMTLYMDEETAIGAEGGGIDARDVDAFDAWLLADPAHLDQVLPEQRGVVVLQPRRRGKDYGDPWTSAARNAENAESYWLIRNGDCLYRMWTDIRVGDRLIPTRDEFTSFFQTRRWNTDGGGYETVPLTPGSPEWLRAEKAADARQRHYMKTALVLQGLLDRTAVFHPLPAPTVSVLSPESYDAGHVRVVTDADAALNTGREPFHAWLARLNRQLRPGMRIVGNFRSQAWYDANSHERRGGRHDRLSPDTAYPPASGEIHRIERVNRDGSFTFLYQRSDQRWGYEHGDWGEWGQWPYKQRASCTIYPDDRFVVPVDLVTVDEVRAYLAARGERHAYQDMFPILHAVLDAKAAEAASEAPFRQLLAGEIANANGVSVADAAADVPELVDWWKLATRWHRPLVDPDPATQAKAVRRIVAEHAARTAAAAAGADPAEQQSFERILAEHPDALLVARKRDRSWVAYVAANAGNVYVHEHTWTATGRSRTPRPWRFPNPRWATWTVLHRAEAWAGWDHAPDRTRHLTGPEFDTALADALAAVAAGDTQPERPGSAPMAVLYQAATAEFTVVFDDVRDPVDDDERISGPFTPIVVTAVRVTWTRGRGGVDVRAHRSWHPTMTWHSRDPWPWAHHRPFDRTEDRSDIDVVTFDGTVSRGQVVVWADLAAADVARTRRDAVRAAQRTEARRSARVADALTQLTDAWEARAWADAHARFCEDYQDPALWDGHRKTLRIHPDRRAVDAIWQRLAVLADADEPLAGRTVADLDAAARARAAAGAPIPDRSSSLPGRSREFAPIADDWLDLPVDHEPELAADIDDD